MVGRRRRIIWGRKAYWLKRQRLRLEVYDTWRISATFRFLYLSFCHYQKEKSIKRLTKWLSKSLAHCDGAGAEGGLQTPLVSVPMCCPRCWGKARGITVIPKCALAATKPSQRPGQPAPCGWQAWGPPARWGEHWTHSVRSRQTAHDVVGIWQSWDPPS